MFTLSRFVYEDYLWRNSDGSNYSEFNRKLIPARIPISTMLSGKDSSIVKSAGAGLNTLPF